MTNHDKIAISSVVDRIYVDAQNQLVDGFEITFSVNNTHTFTIQTPKRGYTPELAKQLIQEKWDTVKATLDISF